MSSSHRIEQRLKARFHEHISTVLWRSCAFISMPARRIRAQRKVLNPSMGRVRRLIAPAVHSGMIDRDSTLRDQFLEVPQAQRIGHLPAHASQNHIERVMQAFEHSGRRRVRRLHRAFTRS
jgi:hypothetical protein